MQENNLLSCNRRALLGGMFILPMVSFIPAHAIEDKGTGSENLTIAIENPVVDSQNFQLLNKQPIYSGTSGEKVLQTASLPPTLIIRNGGEEGVVNASGILSLQMRDLGSDAVPAGGAHKTRLQILNSDIELTYLGKDLQGGANYSWILKKKIEPGENLRFDFRYYVDYPFANIDYELLVTASVLNQNGSNSVSQDQKMGTVPGFARYA